MKILILGSEGTLGKSLCKILIDHNYEIVRWDIKLGNDFDLRIPNILDNMLKEVDYVIFLAFDVGGSKYNVFSKDFMDNNIKLLLNTFHSLFKSNTKFIYTTTCMSNMLENPYGVIKKIGEFYVNLKNGINVKLWNVYGDEDINDKSHVIPDFINSAITKTYIEMRTDGSDMRQFIHSNDFSKAIMTIIENHDIFYDYLKNSDTKTIDISNYEWNYIYDIANEIKTIFKEDYNINIEIIKGNCKDNHSIQNIPSKSILNDMWSPSISLKYGLKNIIELQYKKNECYINNI